MSSTKKPFFKFIIVIFFIYLVETHEIGKNNLFNQQTSHDNVVRCIKYIICSRSELGPSGRMLFYLFEPDRLYDSYIKFQSNDKSLFRAHYVDKLRSVNYIVTIKRNYIKIMAKRNESVFVTIVKKKKIFFEF